MPEIPDSALGKIFVDPVTKRTYGPMRRSSLTHFSNLDDFRFRILAADSCGNYFTVTEDGAVRFWDHETDELTRLANSVSDFVTQCADPPPVEFDPNQVKSVWIDPAFAKSQGMKVPRDGWVKKPPKRK